MGSVFLTVTGSEAMFGDLGHFNALAIRMSALGIVLPALLACYCGQAAAIIQDPTIVSNTFYRSLPSPLLLFPMVVLSTMAAIIASQSMVSASFSLISQAIGKNCFPRMTVRRTDRFQFGAVYVPEVNYFYMVSCVFIVCLFRSSSALGDAYGVAVSTLFCITTFFYSLAIVHHFDKGVGPALLFLCAFGAFDVGFFLANLSKIQDGGWFTVLLSFWFSACAITYRWGRKRMLEQQLGMSRPNAELFLGDLPPPKSAKPLMICMSSLPDAIPASFVHFFHRAHTRPQYLVFLTVHVSTTEAVMRDPAGELALAPVHGHDNVFRANVRCGFLDADLDIKPLATRLIRKLHCIDLPDAASDDDVLAACDPTFLLGRDSVVPLPGSSRWHVWAVFAFSLLLGTSRSRIFSWKMPPEEVLECCLYVGI
jgi:KUP system potassium uptake protein